MTPAIPGNVHRAISEYPENAREKLKEIRAYIYEEAERLKAAPLTETLKWGEPAYLTEATKTGSTIRIAWKKNAAEDLQFLVNCKTDMIQNWRSQFPNLRYQGNRAIHFKITHPLPETELRLCIARALTYHQRR
jgi:hypothetical protein